MKDLHTVDEEKKESKLKRTLAELSVTVWLTPENSLFYQKNGFLYVRYQENEARVFLCRQFPLEMLWEFISVLDEEQQEIGIIRRIDLFEDRQRELLETELRRRYFAPVIEEILHVKERYGFSYWKVRTSEGTVNFTLHDTFRSIFRARENRLILSDVDGNRFEIPDVEKLDRKSYKKIELYL